MKKNRVRELWKLGPSDLSLDMDLSLSNWHNDDRHIAAVQRIFAAVHANGKVRFRPYDSACT